jgi:hypothetical protein
MALAVFVLFVAGLLGRTLQSLHAIDTGLDADHITVVELSWPDDKFSNQRVAALYENLLPKLKALRGVTSAATVNVVPFTGATGRDGRFVAEGEESASPVLTRRRRRQYFETMKSDPRRSRVRYDGPTGQRSRGCPEPRGRAAAWGRGTHPRTANPVRRRARQVADGCRGCAGDQIPGDPR